MDISDALEGMVLRIPSAFLRGHNVVVVISKVSRDSHLLLYCYAVDPSTEVANMTLSPHDAVYVTICSPHAVVDGRWKIEGRLPDWEPKEWPLPRFKHWDSFRDRWLIMEYKDGVFSGFPNAVSFADEDTVRDLPDDGFASDAFVEGKLQLLLKNG